MVCALGLQFGLPAFQGEHFEFRLFRAQGLGCV